MNKHDISDIIYNHLNYMYCDNCRYLSEKSDNGYGCPCDECDRKRNGWAISRSISDYIAEKIIELKEG